MPLREVEIRPLKPARLASVIGAARLDALATAMRGAARQLGPRTVVNVNSTATGGGVAELLETLLGYARSGGINTRWLVVEGDPDFFEVTKRIHNGLYGAAGDGGRLGERERAVYERTMSVNAAAVDGRVRKGDLVLLHDPQTAGLVPAFRRLGATIVWRCHVGSDTRNRFTDRSWRFLRPYLEDVDGYVFSSSRFPPGWVDRSRTRIISPSIDPFSPKNLLLTRPEVGSMLAGAGLVASTRPPRTVRFPRGNGRTGVLRHQATVLRDGPPPPASAPLVVQISRWDWMKDMAGVMAGFAESFDRRTGAHLVLAGPAVEGVADDPEATRVFEDCRARWEQLPQAVRRHVHLASLPTADHGENAVLTNALQRGATIVCQKSLAEGFGLTVAEAMWKGRPMIASAVGGIVDQIPGPRYGVLLDDPTDVTAFASAVDRLLREPAERRRIGANGRRHIARNLLVDRHLQRYGELVTALLSAGVGAG